MTRKELDLINCSMLLAQQSGPTWSRRFKKTLHKSVAVSNSGLRLVDVGAGSGRWVVEVAEQFPSTHVYGIDLSPIEPSNAPLNAEFIVMDLTKGLEFDDRSTDFVHSR